MFWNRKWTLALLSLAMPLLLGIKGCEDYQLPCKGKKCGPGGGGGGGSTGGGSTKRCGTRGGVTCADGEFCNFAPDAECGATDRGGICEPVPEACILIFKPVCGCDGKTYSNDCHANSAGVSVQHEGECESASETCGGIAGLTCEEGEFCNYEPKAGGQGCDGTIADAAGVCEAQPQACTREFRPVCGCDHKTYGNKCEAHSHGVSVLHDGKCKTTTPGKTCGGIAALTCDAGQFCNYEPSAGGQGCDGTIADAAGKCEATPEACTEEFNPVCGCDRKSYGNKCAAHASGVSVLHDGACTEIDCKALGGRAVDGFGPPPQCADNETNHTWIMYSNGNIAIEGTACCVPN